MMLLERPAGQSISRVTAAWVGKVVVCVATGPSLTREQLEAVRSSGHPVIAVNDAYLLCDFAGVVYFADVKWSRWQREGKDKPELGLSAADVRQRWKDFKGQKCTIAVGHKPTEEPGAHVLRNARANGLSQDPSAICTGSHSGYQALNLAVLAKPAKVVLLGYDCQAVAGRDHFFGTHPDKSKPPYRSIRQCYRQAADVCKRLGVKVVNATPGSAIDAFPKVELAASLQPDPAPALVS